MSPSRRRGDVPDFDPYGYSPFDAQFKAQNDANAAAAAQLESKGGWDDQAYNRRSSAAGRLEGYDERPDYGHRRSAKKSGSRRSSRARDHDDGWETDYDPMDKYYLSGDDQHNPTQRYSKDDYKPKSSSRDRDGDSHRHHHSSHHSSSKSKNGHSRRDSHDNAERSNRHYSSHQSSSSPSSRPKAMTRNSSYGGGGRPRAVARNSSYGSTGGGGSRRPHAVTRGSSYAGRPRGAKYPPNASRSKGVAARPGPTNSGRDCMGQAAKAALKAGAIAALKVSSERGSFVEKGAKVASAALGAAAVDALLTRKKPAVRGGKRHSAAKEVAEMAIGLLVAKPAMKGLGHRRPIMGM